MTKQMTVNEAQLRVLQWIADGCPDGVMQGDTHKTSAVALQNRGLAVVRRRGGVWSAQITDAGLRLLAGDAQVQIPVPRARRRRKGSASESQAAPAPGRLEVTVARRPRGRALVEDVVAAGGRLVLPVGHDLGNVVGQVNRHALCPDGQRLALGWEKGRQVVWLEPDPRAQRPVRLFTVPPRVARLHPAAKVYRDEPDLHQVSRAHLARAVRIVHALATEAEARGYRFETSTLRRSGYWTDNRSLLAQGQFVLIIGGCSFNLRLQEISGPGGRLVTGLHRSTRPLWLAARNTTFVPTGRLSITVDGGYGPMPGRSGRFADGARVRLEDRLALLMQELEVRALERDIGAEEQRRAELEQERRWRAEVERATTELVRAHRGRVLEEQAAAWERAARLRAYLAAMQASIEGLSRESERVAARKWLDWCAEFVDDVVDPLGSPLAMPPAPEVTLERLRPHLRWQGPFGVLAPDQPLAR